MTAPKDGTPVLLFGRIEWEDYGDPPDPPEQVVAYWDGKARWPYVDTGGWVLINANPYTDFCHPTHWMPLPADPIVTKEE